VEPAAAAKSDVPAKSEPPKVVPAKSDAPVKSDAPKVVPAAHRPAPEASELPQLP
jgi:hypothetical protein